MWAKFAEPRLNGAAIIIFDYHERYAAFGNLIGVTGTLADENRTGRGAPEGEIGLAIASVDKAAGEIFFNPRELFAAFEVANSVTSLDAIEAAKVSLNAISDLLISGGNQINSAPASFGILNHAED